MDRIAAAADIVVVVVGMAVDIVADRVVGKVAVARFLNILQWVR